MDEKKGRAGKSPCVRACGSKSLIQIRAYLVSVCVCLVVRRLPLPSTRGASPCSHRGHWSLEPWKIIKAPRAERTSPRAPLDREMSPAAANILVTRERGGVKSLSRVPIGRSIGRKYVSIGRGGGGGGGDGAQKRVRRAICLFVGAGALPQTRRAR